MVEKSSQKAWVLSVDMGYGHQRAAYPFEKFAYERIITVNSDKLTSESEQKLWSRIQGLYETLSRLSESHFFGRFLFHLYDTFQKIQPLYPFRDLSAPSVATYYMNRLLRKGICQSVLSYTQKESLPIITPFYLTALAAQRMGFKRIYCIVTDTDINRVWVSQKASENKIHYLVPNQRVVKRLQSYGVLTKHIHLTGFPLPTQLIGSVKKEILKANLRQRLMNLDPHSVFLPTIKKSLLGSKKGTKHPLTLTFFIGGAGAQTKIGFAIVRSLRKKILQKKIRVIIVAGTHLSVASQFSDLLATLGLKHSSYIMIQKSLSKKEYFDECNTILQTTDILWTKPSELSFYTALGIPIICSPPIGAHEIYNLRWLQQIGSGFEMDKVEAVDEWLFDWLEKGIFAKGAIDGFLFAESLGTYNICAQCGLVNVR